MNIINSVTGSAGTTIAPLNGFNPKRTGLCVDVDLTERGGGAAHPLPTDLPCSPHGALSAGVRAADTAPLCSGVHSCTLRPSCAQPPCLAVPCGVQARSSPRAAGETPLDAQRVTSPAGGGPAAVRRSCTVGRRRPAAPGGRVAPLLSRLFRPTTRFHFPPTHRGLRVFFQTGHLNSYSWRWWFHSNFVRLCCCRSEKTAGN